MLNSMKQSIASARDTIRDLLLWLNNEGFKVVLAGGAVRDLCHGVLPKDFDIFDLSQEHYDEEDFEAAAAHRKGQLERIPGFKVLKVCHSYRDGSQNVAYVLKCVYAGYSVDYIAYASDITSPTEQVENFDTTLNMVWYAAAEDQVVMHPELVKVINYEAPVRPLSTLDGDVESRLNYLRDKYPQYQYSNEVLHV